MSFVLDTSVAVSWCFADEDSLYATRVLHRLESDSALVSTVWPLEVANALGVSERRGRLTTADVARFRELLTELPIKVDPLSIERALVSVLSLAQRLQLSAYDASFLELAVREGLPLANNDVRLGDAARKLGVPLVE